METQASKVVVITGTSSGLGKLTAKELATQGHRVYASMREPDGRNRSARDELMALAHSGGLHLRVLEIDVTCDESVSAGIAEVLECEDHIDVLINNAGVMHVGVTEAFCLDEVRSQFEVNFHGALRMNQAVLPSMRAHGSGLLVHLSSLAGRLTFPFFGIYCASKFALEAMAESLRYELSSFGVDSILVEPGLFWTGLIHKSPPNGKDVERLASYGEVARIPGSLLTSFTQRLTAKDAPDPQMVADAIAGLIAMEGPRPLRTAVGQDLGVGDLNRSVAPVQASLLKELGLSHLAPHSAKAPL
ncbi:MAG: NAD(P)-dependent dehydrogenase (short-subunit alcohol dehydrogenase family) [Planctomycetota bacterium]|jgi:NAD(P)-dependent dehydrogenase (short-subunit alcohol dehydrogenase family)